MSRAKNAKGVRSGVRVLKRAAGVPAANVRLVIAVVIVVRGPVGIQAVANVVRAAVPEGIVELRASSR